MDTLKQFNLAMQYIEEHLTEEINFQMVSRLACCSEYHFRRMFASLAGMSLSDYIRRRRLSQAMLELHQSNIRVVDLAIKYGYGSADAFSRAFQALHGITPSEARNAPMLLKAFPPLTFQLTVRGSEPLEYRIVEKPAFSIIGIHERIPLLYGGANPKVVALWEQLSVSDLEALLTLSNVEPHGVLDAVLLPCIEEQREGTLIDYYIGVASTHSLSTKWQVLPVCASMWGVFLMRGAFPQSLDEIWEQIYGEWMLSAGYQTHEGPHLVYTESWDEDMSSPNFLCQLWIPIMKSV